MLTVIMGENSLGKTLYLRNRYVLENSVVSNIPDLLNTYMRFDSVRMEALAEFTGGEVTAERDTISLVDGIYKLNGKTQPIVNLLCTAGDVLLLDEPDLLMDNDEDINDVYSLIMGMSSTFKDVYVATHRGNMLGNGSIRLTTISDDGNLVDIQRKDVYGRLL